MKKLLLLLFALPLIAMAQTTKTQAKEDLQLVDKLYYERGSYIASEQERGKLASLIADMRADSTFKVHIIGYGDKWGGEAVNNRFSYVRAMYIADWMRSCRVPREQILFIGEGIDSLATNDREARRVEVLQVVAVEVVETQQEPEQTQQEPVILSNSQQEPEQTQQEPEPTQQEPEPTQQEPELTQQEQEPTQQEPVILSNSQQEPVQEQEPEPTQAEPKYPFEWKHFTPRTNLLYWAGGLMNIGAEYKHPDSDFGFVLNGGYSPFGNTGWSHNLGGWFIAPEFRYYIPRNDQWFVGAQFLAGGYNIKLSQTGRQGTVIGGGALGGYCLTLSETFDMDFTLGLGYGHLKYDTYYHDDATNTNPYKTKGITKNSLIPIQTGVNLIWKIK